MLSSLLFFGRTFTEDKLGFGSNPVDRSKVLLDEFVLEGHPMTVFETGTGDEEDKKVSLSCSNDGKGLHR